jgi:hypothetical protein
MCRGIGYIPCMGWDHICIRNLGLTKPRKLEGNIENPNDKLLRELIKGSLQGGIMITIHQQVIEEEACLGVHSIYPLI